MGDAEEKIKVVVRVRDLIGREKDQLKAFTVQDATDIVQKNTNKSWTFDRVYSKLDNNRTVYSDTAAEIIDQTVSGFNTTIFAYGQTSSGKTHTMHGNPQEPGVIGMAVEQLFYAVEDSPDRRFLMQVSYLEIYNETVIDLLSDPKTRTAGGLKVRENEEGDVYVENLEQKTVTSPEEIHSYMKLGEKSRHVGQTKMNDKSSRSHTIFRITLESTNRLTDDDTMEDAEEGRQVTVSQLNLVDLAGSEKAAQTGAGGARLKEGCNINQSLMVLGQVIQKLSGGDKGHINFRDSKLTRILQNSIGGNAKTAIICTVTPAAMSEEQTISTLRFASQAKTIQNHATVNEVLDDQAQINRLKKDMAKLMKELEQQKKEANTDMVQEMREQLERERMEKEEHVRKIRELQEKVITSSQPAPPRKSMMFKKKERRETWCGPAMKRNMRMSLAPHKFLKPLLPLDFNLPVLVEDPFPIQSESMANLSLASADFNMSHNTMEQQLDNMEAKRLSELDMMEEDESYMVDESVFEQLDAGTILQVDKKRAVKFVSSPQFMSPRRKFNSSIADLNLTDNGTPKAVIRDKYKRVSIALTSRQVELDMERQARLDLEREHLELQEFTRLESESGVEDERRMSVASGGSDADLVDKLKWYEKSFKDSERLNIGLGKELSEFKQESSKLKFVVEDLTEQLETVSKKEEKSAGKLTELLPLVQEVKELREKTVELEKNKMDFDMQLEMAVEKKETAIVDLRKYLESAYEEIATLESGNKDDVRGRLEKMRNLGKRVEELEVESKEKDNLVEEAEIMKDEYEGLKEGMEVVTAEMIKLSEEKVALEDELKSLQSGPEQGDNPKLLERLNNQEAEIVRIEGLLQSKTVEISNLELSNASLLETVDELSRKTEENIQKNSELLVTSAELKRFNVELAEEISQLKVEVKGVVEVKDKLEVENQELRSELEEVMTSKTDLEEFINRSQNTDEIEEMKKDLKNVEAEKAKLEAMLKGEERSIMINKLSATLNSIEESFIAVEETNKTCADESPGNATFASVANSTFGVPLEVVEEMKNQLLYLQQQLINFSPEELERKVAEIEELRKENAQLNEKVDELYQKRPEDEEAPLENFDKLFEERVDEMKSKHKAELAIITTKMREEMNFNMPALEEKLRDEFEEKKQEALKEIASKHEEKFTLLQEDLKKSEIAVVELQDLLKKSQVEVKSATENLSSQKNTTLGVVPAQRLESLNITDNPYVTCEMSFDDTLGSGSMNMTMETNPVFSGGIGDSLQVQMLKGELEMIKNTLEEKEQIIEKLMEKQSESNLEFSSECAQEQNIHEELEAVKKALIEKEVLIEEMKKASTEPIVATLERDGVNERLVEVQNELEEARKSLEEKSKSDEMESDETKRKVDEYQETIKELQDEISEFETLRVKGEDYIQELIVNCDKLEETVEKNDELEDRNEDLNKKIVEGQLQFESLSSNIEALTTQIKSLEDLVEIKSQELESMGELKDENVKLVGNLEEVSQESDKLRSALTIEVEKAQGKKNELKAAREIIAELESMKEEDFQKNTRIEELENLVEVAENKVSESSVDNAMLEATLKEMEIEKISLVENYERTREDLEDANEKSRNLEEGLENAMSDLESAIIEKETAQELIGQFESKISELTDAVANSNTVQEELKSTQANLVQELDAARTQHGELVKRNSQLTLEIDNLAVDAKRFEEMKAELEEKVSKLDENIRVLNQDKENEKMYYEKCLHDAKSDSTLVATMSSKLAEMETKYDEEVASKLELETKFLGLLDNVKDEKTSLEKHLNLKESEFITGINEKESILSKLSEENCSLNELVKCLKSDVQNSVTEMKAAESNIVSIETELKEKANAEAKLQSSLSEQVAALENIKSLMKEKVAAEAELESKLKDKTDAAENLVVELKERNDELAVYKSESEANKLSQSSANVLQEQVISLQKDLESVQADLTEVEKQRDTVNDECDRLEAKLAEVEESLETNGQKVTEVDALQSQVATLTAQLKNNIHVAEENKVLRDELAEVNSKVESTAQYEAKIDDLETQVERLKFDLGEAEKLRDIVDAECDKLESELEETKVRMIELNTTQDAGNCTAGQLNSLQSTMIAGQQTLLNNVSMDCTFIPAPDISHKLRELELEKEQLEREMNDLKRQLASTPTEEKYVNLKSQLIKQKEYSDKVYEENKQLKGVVTQLHDEASPGALTAMEVQLAEVKEELGRKNIEYASLKVDVEKGELQYKKKCEILQSDLDYEKTNSTRLTQEIRRFQSSAMDTTVINPKVQTRTAEVSSAACNTSATTAGSPVWSSGSGAIKEIRLHSAEMRVKSLEKENNKLKEHEEFYINKAREWKSRALKYEKTLEQNGVPVPSKENRRETLQGVGGAANTSTTTKANEKAALTLPPVDPATAKVYQAAGLSPRTSANPLKDLQNLRSETGPSPPTPTEDIKLVLSRRSESRRTEEDFRLPDVPGRGKPDDCKTQ